MVESVGKPKSLVGIVARLGLDDTGFFSSAKRPYLLWGTPSLLLNVPVVKRPEREADHSPPSSATFRIIRATPLLCHECLSGLYSCYCAFGSAGLEGALQVKGNVHPRTGHEGPEGEYSYSCTLFLTSVLDGVDGQRHAPAAISPGKTRYPLCRRLGGPQSRSGHVRKILLLPGFYPRTVHPVTGRYTD